MQHPLIPFSPWCYQHKIILFRTMKNNFFLSFLSTELAVICLLNYYPFQQVGLRIFGWACKITEAQAHKLGMKTALFRQCSECSDFSDNVQNFQSTFRMFRISSEFSVNVQNVQTLLRLFQNFYHKNWSIQNFLTLQ